MKYRLVLILVCGIVTLTGCIDSTTEIEIEEDGSGTIELTRLIDTTFANNYVSDNGSTFSPGSDDIERICSELADTSNYPEEATVTPVERASTCGVRVTIEVLPGGDLASQLASLESSMFGPMSELFTAPNEDDYIIEQRDEQWIFKMPAPSVRRLNSTLLSENDAESILALSDFTYQISLPGNAIADENNADSAVGGTFTWNIDPTNGPALLEARTTPPSQNLLRQFGIPVLAAVVGLLIVVGTIMHFRSRRRSNPKDSGDSRANVPEHAAGENTDSADDAHVDGPHDDRRDDEAIHDDGGDKEVADNSKRLTNPVPSIASLPLGASSPEWNEDLQMWLSTHEVKGRLFFDERSERWEPLR